MKPLFLAGVLLAGLASPAAAQFDYCDKPLGELSLKQIEICQGLAQFRQQLDAARDRAKAEDEAARRAAEFKPRPGDPPEIPLACPPPHYRMTEDGCAPVH